MIYEQGQTIEDISLFNEGIIANCNEEQIIAFARDICDNDNKLKIYKQTMIKWMQQNKFDGSAFLKHDATQFGEEVASQSADGRLNRAGYNLYQQLFALNKGIPISRFIKYIGFIDEKIKNKLRNIDSIEVIADCNGNVPAKIVSLLAVELSNMASSTDDTQDTLFIIEMAKIWDELIDVDKNGSQLKFE